MKKLRKVDREITKTLSKPLYDKEIKQKKKEIINNFTKLSLDYEDSKQYLTDMADDLNTFLKSGKYQKDSSKR